MKTRLLLLGIAFVGWTNLPAQTPVITRGPYLQLATPTTSVYLGPRNTVVTPAGVTLRWRTSVPTRCRVRFGTALGNLTGAVTEGAASADHSVRLTPLESNMTYFYSVETVEPFRVLEGTADHFFTTPPDPGTAKKTRVWVLGDFGNETVGPRTPPRQQDSVIVAFRDFMQQNATGPMDLWLWLGDNAYDAGTDAEYQTSIFDKTWARYDWAFRQTPFYATPGNHEYKSGPPEKRYDRANHLIPYFDIVDTFKNAEGGGEPSGTERYYSFNHGNAHFISLDTYGTDRPYATEAEAEASILALGSAQRNWLRRDLMKAQADPSLHWIIVFTHMPPFTGGTHNSDTESELGHVRRNLVPLLDSFKVDLVFTGHSHAYERSRLMRGHTGLATTFSQEAHNNAAGSNARSSGRYDGSANGCFYYKSTKSVRNEGIIYAVSGAGGRDETQTPNFRLKNTLVTGSIMQSVSTKGGSVYLEIDGKRLDVKYVAAGPNLKAQVVDRFTIFKDLDAFTVPPTDDTSRTATCECTDDVGQHGFTHYVDNKANLLLSIKKGGNVIGTAGQPPFEVKLQGKAGSTGVGSYAPTNYVRSTRVRTLGPAWRVMNRYWTVKPTTELAGNQQVTVRHYHKKADVEAINTGADPNETVFIDLLNMYKINDPGGTLNLNPTTGSHNSIPRATAFNRPGAWVYDRSGASVYDRSRLDAASTLAWKSGHLGKEHYYHPSTDTYFGEMVVGRLRGGGGFGGQFRFASPSLNPTGDHELVLTNDLWRYLATGNAPASAAWKGGGEFDDRAWPVGKSPLGYSPNGEDLEQTRIPACAAELPCFTPDDDEGRVVVPGCLDNPPCSTKWITTYFRKSVFLPANLAPLYKSFIISYRRDDGILIYINGKELLVDTKRDSNMDQPPTAITNSTLALDASSETEWQTVVVPNDGSYFRVGTNVVAAEVHQVTAGSSDLAFDLEIVASPDVLTAPARLAAEPWTPIQEATAVTLYPNPTADGRVRFSSPLTYQTLRLTDARGVVLRYFDTPGRLNELDLSHLPSGVYHLVSQGADQISRFKISKP